MPLSIQLTPEAASEVRKYIPEKGWSESEGVQILLSAGIGFIAGKYLLRAAQMSEYGEAEGEVSSLKYRLFEMRESNMN